MRKRIILSLTVFIFVLTTFIVAHKLTAQNATKGLSITPTSLELTIKPGESVTKTISLSNFTEKTVDISVSRRNFTANGEEGEVFLTEEENAFSLSSWIKTSPESQTLKPDQKKDFEVTITAPKNAEPGGHFGSVVFSTKPQSGLTKTGALLSQEVAGLILVKIPGTVNEQAEIKSFSPEKNFYENGPVNFNVRVKNGSTVHIKPTGTVTVTDMFGQKSYAQIDPKNVLPGAIRKIQATLTNKFLIGKYEAKVEIAYGAQNNALLSATTSFWAFPVKAGIVVLVILIIIYLMRRRLAKALKTIITGK